MESELGLDVLQNKLLSTFTHSLTPIIHSFIHSLYSLFLPVAGKNMYVQKDLLRTAMKGKELKVPNLNVEILQARCASDLLVKMVYIWHAESRSELIQGRL